MKKNLLASSIVVLFSITLILATGLLSLFERRVYNFVGELLSSKGISIKVEGEKFGGFSHFKYDNITIKIPSKKIDLSIGNFDFKLLKKKYSLDFGNFVADIGSNFIETNGDDCDVGFVFDKNFKLQSLRFDIPDMHVALKNGIEIYTVSIKSEDSKRVSIRTLSAINEKDSNFEKIETNYLDIDIKHLDLLKLDADVVLSFRFLPIKYSGAGADFYDTSLHFSSISKKFEISLDAQSFDIKNKDNVMLTLDDAKVNIKNPNTSKSSKYTIELDSNILKFKSQADLSKKTLQATLNMVRLDGVKADLELDFSNLSSLKANSNIDIDTKISNFQIKGKTSASFENGRVFVAGDGFVANSITVIPYADFRLSDVNKSVYLDVAFDSEPYCIMKLDFSDNEASQFLTLIFPGYNYPIKVTGSRRRFDLFTPGKLDINIDYFNYLKLKAELNNFVLPARAPGFNAKKDITINLSLGLSLENKNIKISPSHIDFKVVPYNVSTDFSYNNNFLSFDNIQFADETSIWNGYASFSVPESMNIKDVSCNISAFQKNGDGRIVFNATKSSFATDLTLKANEVSASFLRGFGISYIDANINLRTDFKTIQFATGNIQSRNLLGEHLLSGDINFDGGNINLYNASFEYNKMKFRNMKLSFDSSNMTAEVLGNISTGYWRFDRTLPISTDIKLNMQIANMAKSDDLFFNFSSLINPDMQIKGTLEINNTRFDDLKFDDIYTQLEYENKTIKLSGSQLEGTVDFRDKNAFSLDIGLLGSSQPISGKFGFKKIGNKFRITANLYQLNYILMTKLLINPIITFYRGNIKGWAEVEVEDKNVDMKCSLHANQLVFDTLWLENERFVTNDVNIVSDGRLLRLKLGSAVAVNRISGGANKVSDFEAGMYFENEDMNPYWYMSLTVPKDQYVQVNIPIVPMNYTVDIGKANGLFNMKGQGMSNIMITGDLFVDNVTMGSPARAPDWFIKVDESTGKSSLAFSAPVDFDLNVTVGQNASFSYPSPENALLNATLKENQTVRVVYFDRTGSFNIDRDVEIERGEVFYFNRKFIIESGSFSWPEREKTDFLSIKNNDMKINLFASLRDFDKKGNSIDLYINFKDASVGNLNPSFSASVPMDQSEVLYRFGQSIYNTQNSNTREEYYTASASLLMDMAFAISSLRDAGSFSLGSNFAKELGIDVWTFRSQMISTFIAETSLSVLNNSYKLSNSVFSRFIDKTSINIGKKLNNDLILSFQIELRSITDPFIKNKGVEIMPDFYCGINLSFEWMTPLARIMLLSQPNDFSFPGFLSGFGINITKTINF